MRLPESQEMGPGFDWIDRAACAYLILPTFLFCLWFIPPLAAVLIALCGYATYRTLRRTSAPRPSVVPSALVAASMALALAWSALAGVGHFFYSNSDWIIRDAVLHDLATAGWPPTYPLLAKFSLILRAPVGYFLPAAAIGRLFGAGVANTLLFFWTACGWGLVLVAACSLFETRLKRTICMLVLFSFGGMDLLGYLWAARGLPSLGEHLEWWMGYVQYSSNSTLMFWVPNHALPAWLPIILILRHWGKPELARMTPLLATAVPLWSPLAAIGLFPFFVFALAWRRDFRILFSLRSSIPFAPIAVLTALYLGMDAAVVRHEWVVPMYASLAAFAYRYALFCLLEFGILALVLARLRPFDAPLRIAVLVLCALPFYTYGPYNDLAMRSSIPALTVLALATVTPLSSHTRNGWHAMLAAILAIGALGAMQEPLRALAHPAWNPHEESLPDAVVTERSTVSDRFPPHYFARPNARGMDRIMNTPARIEQAEAGK
jgi:hypothetical protein